MRDWGARQQKVVPLIPNENPRVAVRLVIEPELLMSVWPFVRKGLAHIKKKQGHSATWTPEHILAALQAGIAKVQGVMQAELWLGFVDNELCAFAVTQEMSDVFTHTRAGMLVWMAYRDPKCPALIVDEMDVYLADQARMRGYAYIEAITTRPGLVARMARNGWRPMMYMLRKGLYPEE